MQAHQPQGDAAKASTPPLDAIDPVVKAKHSTEEFVVSDLFYIQDSRSNVGSRATFWRIGGGYTSNLREAEQFTRACAVKQYEARETDVPWPVAYVEDRYEIGVDFQYLDSAAAAATQNQDGRVFVAYDRTWDGNDLIWIGGDGPTSDLVDAIHPGQETAEEYLSQGFRVWPVDYIVNKCRAVVRAANLNHKQALREVGLTLPKTKHIRIRSYNNLNNCGGCGRFLSERQRFDDCPNCGESNAP